MLCCAVLSMYSMFAAAHLPRSGIHWCTGLCCACCTALNNGLPCCCLNLARGSNTILHFNCTGRFAVQEGTQYCSFKCTGRHIPLHLSSQGRHINLVFHLHRKAHNIAPYSVRLSLLNTSVSLFNADWANTNPQPLPPNFITCGALTAKPAGPLPPHLESFVGSAKSGVVYASLGTTVIPGAFPPIMSL